MKNVGILECNLSGSGFMGFEVCKKAGFHITFFTRNLSRYRDIPMGKRYIDQNVDVVHEVETNNYDQILDFVMALHQERPFDAFLTLSEYDIVPTARIAQALGVRHVQPEAALKARNKHMTREACLIHGVPAPLFVAVRDRHEVADAVAHVGLPCIVKPADETSSTDVIKCRSVDEAIGHFDLIRSKPKNVRGQDRYEFILIEQCISGFEVSVETMTIDGTHHVYGVTDKMLGGDRHFVEVGHAFPSGLSQEMVDACASVAVASLDALGYTIGAAHVEVKVDDEGPKLIEVNGRPGGDRIPDLVAMVTGRDPVCDHVHAFLGIDLQQDESEEGQRSGAAISFFHATPGTIQSTMGEHDIAYTKNIKEIVLPHLLGKVVEPLTKSSTRLGYIIASGENGFHAWRQAETARAMLIIDVL
jgi:biotin carboxylase